MEEGSRIEGLRERVLRGPILATMLALAAPMIAARMLATTQEIVDAALLGRVSAEDLAAPTAVWPFIWLFMGLAFGVNTASVASVSQLVGAKRFREAERAAGEFLGLVLALSVAGALAVMVLAPSVYRLQGIPPGVYEIAVAFTMIDLISVPFMASLLFFNTVSAAAGDTRKPFKLSALSSLLNLALDPILIFGLGPIPQMGAIGAALATTISRVVAGGLALYLLLTGYVGLRVTPRRPSRWALATAVKVGGPVAAQQVLVSSGFLVMNAIVAALGATVMAAYNLSLAIIHLVNNIIWGFSSATATMVGQSLGAGMVERAKRAAVSGVVVVGLALSAGSLALYLAAGELARLATPIEGVAEVSESMIRVLSLGVPFLGVFFVSMGAARGSGDTLPLSAVGIARIWLVRIPLSYYLAFTQGMGHMGVWVAMAISNAAAGLAALAWLFSWRWAKPRVGRPGEKKSRLEVSARAGG